MHNIRGPHIYVQGLLWILVEFGSLPAASPVAFHRWRMALFMYMPRQSKIAFLVLVRTSGREEYVTSTHFGRFARMRIELQAVWILTALGNLPSHSQLGTSWDSP